MLAEATFAARISRRKSLSCAADLSFTDTHQWPPLSPVFSSHFINAQAHAESFPCIVVIVSSACHGSSQE